MVVLQKDIQNATSQKLIIKVQCWQHWKKKQLVTYTWKLPHYIRIRLITPGTLQNIPFF